MEAAAISARRRYVGKYEVGRNLGQGRFATVKLGSHVDTGALVAIKIIKKELRNIDKLIMQEISAMKLIKHPNIVQLLEVVASKQNVYLILEYVNNGELLDRIIERGRLEEDEARKYFQQLIRGVDYCHSRGIYHRDLKPDNLLLDDENNLKIADFGLSALHQQRWQVDYLLHTVCGSPDYVAPEVMHEKGYEGAPADLWSCGVILYVLLVGTLPFSELDLSNLRRQVTNPVLEFPSNLSNEAQDLIKRLLDPNPLTRLTIPGICESMWFLASGPLYSLDIYNNGWQECNQCVDSEVCFCMGGDKCKDATFQDNRPVLMNAFEIITLLSPGLDLSGLFEEKECLLKEEVKYTSRQPAREILTRVKNFARQLGYQVRCADFKMRIRNSRPGREGFLCISSQVMEVGPSLFVIDMLKTSGDTLEYHNFQQDFCNGLKDVVRQLGHTGAHNG